MEIFCKCQSPDIQDSMKEELSMGSPTHLICRSWIFFRCPLKVCWETGWGFFPFHSLTHPSSTAFTAAMLARTGFFTNCALWGSLWILLNVIEEGEKNPGKYDFTGFSHHWLKNRGWDNTWRQTFDGLHLLSAGPGLILPCLFVIWTPMGFSLYCLLSGYEYMPLRHSQ